MKTVKKNVYYCDYCNKRGLSASHIRQHELHCTANPNRKCRLCGGFDLKSYVEELKKRFYIWEKDMEDGEISYGPTMGVEWTSKEITLDEIIDYVECCPNCVLAVLRQTKLNYQIFGFNYDYQKELAEWWSEFNRDAMRNECYY